MVGTQIVHTQLDVADAVLALWKTLAQFAAHHHGDNFVKTGFGDVAHTCILAIAQNGDAVANGENLFHAVGNVHKGNAFVFQLAHGFKQGLNFAVGEGGSGLVHHDVFGMRCDGFGNFHQLLFAHRQIASAGFRVYVQP